MAGWGSCEFSELRRLAERMDDLQAHVGEISTAMVKELAVRMLDKVTKRTPVGRKPKLEGPRTERVRRDTGAVLERVCRREPAAELAGRECCAAGGCL